ncbi:MAG: DnaA/Hda family protein [Pseudomonadota bacterium]
MVQSALNLHLAPTYHAGDFVASSSNEAAWQWINQWPQWPAHALTLYGPLGCGKTHLAHIWAEKSGAQLLSGQQWDDFDLGRWHEKPCSIALDQINQPVNQKALLHLYNLAKEQQQFLLINTETHPKMWELTLADLSSRLNATPAVAICQPDDALLKAIMIKLFADQQIMISTNVVDYILPRIDRSFASVKHVVQKMNELALAKQRKITIPLVREVLAEMKDS